MTNDVVSLPIAKKLKEAGWKQDSFWRYADWKPYSSSSGRSRKMELAHEDCGCVFGGEDCFHRFDGTHVAAPTIGELLEALPKELSLLKVDTVYTAKLPRRPYLLHADTPADALAELWLALKEKGLLTP